MTGRAVRVAATVAAAAAALAPVPAAAIERWYSRLLFPLLQRGLTSASNLVPFALFDVLLAVAAGAVLFLWRRRILSDGWGRGTLRWGGTLLYGAAVTYLLFLFTWGMNYRRVPLIEKVAFEPGRVTQAASSALGQRAVAMLNAHYAAAHAAPESLDALAASFQAVHRALGGAPIVPGRPKATLLGWYFHKASIAGMTDPFLLETLLAPDLLEVERPFVIAHEWAHLAGYADESEANFVAYVACGRGDAAARYSTGLMLIGYASSSRELYLTLDPGPKRDLQAIRTRYMQTSRPLRIAARESYDKYLKANRVERGIESYDAVVQLILGTALDSQGYPRMR